MLPPASPPRSTVSPPKRPYLVLYAFHDSPLARENLDFFHRVAMRTEDRARADFVLISNGPLPSGKDLDEYRIRWTRILVRSNQGFDFCAWGHAMETMGVQAAADAYERYIFVNDTVRGPFYPAWLPGALSWTDLLTNQLDASTRLVGISMDCNVKPLLHQKRPEYREPDGSVPTVLPVVHSMLFATDSTGLRLLLGARLFDPRWVLDKSETVLQKEVMLTQVVLRAGYNVTCTLAAYAGRDYRGDRRKAAASTPDPRLPLHPNERTGRSTNPHDPRNYFGDDIHPMESLFVKTGRGVAVETLARMTTWALRAQKQREAAATT